MSNMTLAQLGQRANLALAPDITVAFQKALERNKNLDLAALVSEEKQELTYWFNRYYGIHLSQVANLRETLNRPIKHLALDLVALMKSDVEERAGLSGWFSPAK